MNEAAIETVLKILISAAAAITGWYAALKPLLTSIQARRKRRLDAVAAVLAQDKEYRETVLVKLDLLTTKLSSIDGLIADLQRDNIERAYCMFVVEHGYCPSGMKEAIFDTYKSYKERGYNHIADTRVDQIMNLPEFPEDSLEE